MRPNFKRKSNLNSAIARLLFMAAIFLCGPRLLPAQASFINWETPPVHPIDLSPDGQHLAVCNLPNGRVEIFNMSSGVPISESVIQVGLDPVTARWRTNSELWVVNLISDSISVVDLPTRTILDTILTSEEPQDVAFVTGSPDRAFVSCSHDNRIQIYNATTRAFIQNLTVAGEEPRALAVSPDGSKVYVAIFESGNGSTLLGGGADADGSTVSFPPNVVNLASGPYNGKNPPSNTSGGFNDTFNPPLNPALAIGPPVGLIVKKDVGGAWRDDNGVDWTSWISGPNAAQSGRAVGWTLIDNDLAIVDTTTLSITYATRMMNICMSVAVNPGNGKPYVIGTDGTNEIRFEPVVSGKFLKVEIAEADPAGPTTLGVVDMNPHLNYSTSTIPQSERDKSLGDPRGIVWNSAGTRGYVTGMGSNNMIVIDASGARVDGTDTNPVNLGQGPTGLALDESRGQVYVFNRFDGTISVVKTGTLTERVRVSLFDPTPSAAKIGRKHLYDTHKNSGLGQIACASCHIDGRMDRLSWDLGDPSGSLKSINEINGPSDGANPNFYNNLDGLGTLLGQNLDTAFHPMKGPMTTQTLQDIIGKEPLHWRGDRDGIEQFNGAFIGLQGDDTNLTTSPSGGEMQEFENFLATIYFPPNPFRQITNALPTSVDVSAWGQYTTGKHALAEGVNLPFGNAQNGLTKYRVGVGGTKFDANAFDCVACHALPTGSGSNRFGTVSFFPSFTISFTPIVPGPDGGLHLTMTSRDGSTQDAIKVPELRNLYDKAGLDMKPHTISKAGFGFVHDGSVDTLSRFVDEPVFNLTSDQDVADVVAFLLSFAGGDLPPGRETGTFNLTPQITVEPVGEPSRDTHAGVGKQVVLTSSTVPPTINTMFSEARETGTETPIPLRGVDLIVKGRKDMGGGNFVDRGWFYDRVANNFKEDKNGDTISRSGLAGLASPTNPLTYMMVPRNSGTRLGVDQDEDGYYDRTEIEACTDPANPLSNPGLGAPNIGVSGGPLSFGSQDIGAGPTAPQGVTISNSGPGPLFFKGAKLVVIGADADQFSISNNPSLAQINSGGNRLVNIVFDPSTLGPKSANLLIVSDDCDAGTVTVPLSGTATEPGATPTPSPTDTATPTATETPSPSPSPTPTETESPSPTPTETESPTATESPSPTETPSPTASPSPTPSPTPFNDSMVIGHSMPPTMIPNQSLLVSITLRNKGNTTWTEPNYGLAVVEDPCNLMGTSLIPVGTGSSALPFTNYDFLVQITAPATQGPCLVRLQMTESGSNFGPILVHTITVVSPTNDAKDWTFYE